MWFETSHSGVGDNKMAFSDNLAASEHQRVSINSKGGKQTTATAKDIKPDSTRKVRNSDSRVIIRRYLITERGAKRSADHQRKQRRRQHAASTDAHRRLFLLRRLNKARHKQEIAHRRRRLMKRKLVKDFKGLVTRGVDVEKSNRDLNEKRATGRKSEVMQDRSRTVADVSRVEASIVQTSQNDLLKRDAAEVSKNVQNAYDASRQLVRQTSDAAAEAEENRKFGNERFLRKTNFEDFFAAEEEHINKVKRTISRNDANQLSAEEKDLISKMRRSGFELDVDTVSLDLRALPDTPHWMKDTSANVNPKTLQGDIARSQKMSSNSSLGFQEFSDNSAATIPWQEPAMLANCSTQLMMSVRYSFAPSCNDDGTFLAKQCYLDRCWCVDSAGKPTAKTTQSRFYFKQDGLRLTCVQQLSLPTTTLPPRLFIFPDAAALDASWINAKQHSRQKEPAVMSLAAAQRAKIPIHFHD